MHKGDTSGLDVVIIAYEFPPLNSGGSHRPLRISKYLHSNDIANVVVTIQEEACIGKLDAKLLDDLPEAISVYRTAVEQVPFKWLKDRYYLNIVDTAAEAWKKNLHQQLLEIVERQKPKYLLCTVPPFSLAPLAIELGQELRLPVILDFRDAWSQWIVSPFASYLHYRALLKLEKNCLQMAEKVVVTSLQTIQDFKRIHPDVPNSKYLYVPNSFDEFIGEFTLQTFNSTEKIRIGYVGSFYFEPEREALFEKVWWQKKPYQYFQYSPRRERWLYRSPFYFFKAVRRLLDMHPELSERLELCFAGAKPSWFEKMAQSHQLEGSIKHYGFLNKQEVIHFQKSCDLLLITSSKVDGGRDYSIAGKTYEYFSLQKPIIAFVTEGAQKDILEKSGLALVLNPDDSDGSANNLYQMLTNKVTLCPNLPFIQQFKTINTLQPLESLFR